MKSIFIIFLLAALTACGSTSSPVSTRKTIDSSLESEKLGGRLITIVQRDDTLFSIAFENSLDVNEVAAWNGLTDASRLRIGQRIRLTKPLNYKPKSSVKVSSEPVIVRSSPAVVKTSPNKEAKKISTDSRASSSFSNSGSVKWAWPVRGSIVRKFSILKRNKGIDIATTVKQKIKTSAPGKVVYQGNGIKGYGNLIIIKHSKDMLSAYAYNSQSLVKEGQHVKSGQVISLAGLHNGKSKLHFEIRRNGKPVDPLKYLP